MGAANMLELSVQTVLEKEIAGAARRYASRCWWADKLELEQQGWMIALEYAARWAPRDAAGAVLAGPALASGVRTAVVRQLARWLWRQSSPVSLSDHAAHRRAALGLCRADVETTPLPVENDTPERLVTRRAVQVVRARAAHHAGRGWADAVVAVVCDDEPADEIAAARGLPAGELSRRALAVARLLQADPDVVTALEDAS